MPAVGDEHEAIAVVVPAEDLLEQVAVARLGELGRRSTSRRGLGSQMPRSMLSAAIRAFVVPREKRPIAEAKAAPDVAIHDATARSDCEVVGQRGRGTSPSDVTYAADAHLAT